MKKLYVGVICNMHFAWLPAVSWLLLGLNTVAAQAPLINSFTPLNGPIGTAVTVKGVNFNSAPGDALYFGAVKATIISETTTQIVARVPLGANYQPLTVTSNGLVCNSALPFTVTFNAPLNISSNSFAARQDFTANTGASNMVQMDLDGDGKPDLAVAASGASGIAVLRNTGSPGNVSFDAPINYSSGLYPIGIAAGDLDGDGKPDLVVANFTANTVSVFLNTSTVGNISFVPAATLAAGAATYGVAIADLDGDGRADIIASNEYNGNTGICVFQNLTKAAGTIAFGTEIDVTAGTWPRNLAVADIDGDGKPDVIVANQASGSISILKNSSANNIISFSPKVDFLTTAGSSPESVVIGDFNNDGKPDIAVANNNTPGTISLFANNSTPGQINLANKQDFATMEYPYSIAIGDVNGDGVPDIAVSNQLDNMVSVLASTGVSNKISFASSVAFATGDYPRGALIADEDGDGKPDIVAGNTNLNTVSVLLNTLPATTPVLPPNISYQTPQTYKLNTAITPLSPVNTGGAVPPNIYGQVSTFVGTGSAGAVDGTGRSASISAPLGIAFDGNGNIILADYNNNIIRKITAAGVVTTLAGAAGGHGATNGPEATASFALPEGVAVDLAGNIYIADSFNDLIRKITPDGVVSTVAGQTGIIGSANGVGSNATFNSPVALVIDNAGNLYVSDQNNNMIREISPLGSVSTFAGSLTAGKADGQGTSAGFKAPAGLAIDANNNIYVADAGNDLVRKISPGGLVNTVAGSGSIGAADGQGTAASFNNPNGIAIDSYGTLYVADEKNNRVRKITATGLVSTLAGNGLGGSADGTGSNATFAYPGSAATDGLGNVYIGDVSTYLIRKIGLTGYTIDKMLPPGLSFDPTTGIITGTPTSAFPATNYTITAYNVAGSSSTVVSIAIAGNQTTPPPSISYQTPQTYKVGAAITPLAPTNTGGAVPAMNYGLVSRFAGSGANSNIDAVGDVASFGSPVGLAFDANNNLFVTDNSNYNVRKITPDGTVTTFAGNGNQDITNGPGSTASFVSPFGITVDGAGNLFVADEHNQRIRKITPAAVVSNFTGDGTQNTNDGPLATAEFDNPFGLVFDATGNLIVADRGNSVLRKIDATGQVTSMPPLEPNQGQADTSGKYLGFMAADAGGNLYIPDNYQVKEISPAGNVTVLAGSPTPGYANGTGTAALFGKLYGIGVDKAENIYVGDVQNNRVRKITPNGVVTTLAGGGGRGANDGLSASASFYGPYGVTVDNAGSYLYVADNGNRIIRKICILGYSIDKSLPIGLTFDPTTGIISGTPVVASPATDYVITANNTGGTSAATVSIQVTDPQTVVFGPIAAKTVCDADFDPGATGIGAITYTSNDPAVADIVSGKIHITGAGSAIITANDGVSQLSQPLTVAASVTPTITITPAPADDCQNAVVNFSAIQTNGGSAPFYQWQLNGVNVGENSATFNTGSLNNNDKISCILTSSAVCTTAASVTSNTAIFTLDEPQTTALTITSNAGGPVCAGTPVTFTTNAVTSDKDPIFQWSINGIITGGNSAVFTDNTLADGDVVSCTMTSNGKCLVNPMVTSNSITTRLNPVNTCVITIPTAFSPNGDGINDLWDIDALAGYPSCSVTVYSRYGGVVYNSTGYSKAWDGTYSGRAVPFGTYYYIIDLKNGQKRLAGFVTIIR